MCKRLTYYPLGRLLALFILVALSFPIVADAQSNEGKDFWLGFMEHRDVGNNDMVVMITSRVNTSGTLTIPGRDFIAPFDVSANDVVVINLPTFAETVGSERISNNAINIQANDDISVYMHQYFGMRSEASVVLPTSSVGNSYYVISFTGVPENVFGPGKFPSEFLIVANEDETTVEYTLKASSQNGKRAGTTTSVTLNKGDVYQVRADDPLDDLTGSFVSGDKDFSLFAGTSWSQVPRGCTAMDNLLEQMFPISTWGTRYVASPFANTSSDLYRIIASEDNTSVDIQGGFVNEIDLEAGAFFDFQASDGAFIESSKPISVAQYITGSNCNGGVGDPSMVVLNTVEQIRDTVTLFNSRFFDIRSQFINVISKTEDKDLIFFDNQQLSSMGVSFNTLGDEGDFVYAIIPTTAGAHTLFTQGCGIIAMAYGYGDVESYAYSGGASFSDINANPIPEGGCLNDTIQFDSGLPEDRYNVFWNLGDGTTSEEHKFDYIYPDLGSYPLQLIVEDVCFDEIDTINRELMVTLRQDISAIEDQSGCEGSTIELGAFDLAGARFEWSGPNEYEAEEQFPKIENINLSQAGLYQVVGNISGCRTIPVDVGVEVWENPQPNLGQDTVLCTLDGDKLTIQGGNYSFYTWQDGSLGEAFDVDMEGIYSVLVEDANGCMGRDTINVLRQCPTRFYIPNVFSPNSDRVNDQFGISGIEIISFTLRVYNRWGELIFESQEESQQWDGLHQDREAPAGQYIWQLEYEGFLEDGSTFSDRKAGTVLLMR